MADLPGQTAQLQACIDRLRNGDGDALNDLLGHAAQRLQHLAHKMLNDYRRVRRWEETGDVLQNANLRLLRALRDVPPPTVVDFYRLSALQIRRELIDLSRHHYGPQGPGAHHASHEPGGEQRSGAEPAWDRGEQTDDPDRLSAWTQFHQHIETLPAEEREVFDLIWYQGLSQAEAAALLNVSERTIKRRWQGARLKLHEALGEGDELPGI